MADPDNQHHQLADADHCLSDWGLLWQIVGLKSGWHAAAVMGTAQVHAKRLAQTCAMRLELLAHGAPPQPCPRCHAFTCKLYNTFGECGQVSNNS